MEILIDGEVIEIKPIENRDKSLLEKIKFWEMETNFHYPKFKNIFNTLKNTCCILSLPNDNNLYFLIFTEEEKDFFKKNIENLKKLSLSFGIKDSYVVSFKKQYDYDVGDIGEYKNLYIEIEELLGINLFKKYNFEVLFSAIDNKIFFDTKYDLNLGYRVYKKGDKWKSFVSKKFQLKDLTNFDGIRKLVMVSYLEYLGETNYFIKDILRDYLSNPTKIFVPIDFNLLENAKNKKHLLELKTKKTGLLNRFNKISLNFAYSILKMKKYINEKELNKIILKEILVNDKEKERIKEVFVKYYKENIKEIKELDLEKDWEELPYGTKSIFYDYIDMVISSKYKFNLDIATLKKLHKEHDKVAEIYAIKRYKKEKLEIKETNPFLQLILPKEFKMIKTKAELFQEGKINKNCVFSYITSINKEKCIIYTTLYEGRKYTIEFKRRRDKFILAQIEGFHHSKAPKELIEYIVKCIKDQRIVKKSNLKHEVIGA